MRDSRRWKTKPKLWLCSVAFAALTASGVEAPGQLSAPLFAGRPVFCSLEDSIDAALRSVRSDWPEEHASGIEQLSRILSRLRAQDLARYSDPYGKTALRPDAAARLYIVRELEHAAGLSRLDIRLLSEILDSERNNEVRMKAVKLFRDKLQHVMPEDIQHVLMHNPPTSSLAIVEFLSLFKRRGITLPDSFLEKYRVHHSEAVRQVVKTMVKYEKRTGCTSAKVAESPLFSGFVDRLLQRTSIVPPPNADLVEVRIAGKTQQDESESESLYGWLLNKARVDSIEIMLLSGIRVRIPRRGPVTELPELSVFTAEARAEIVRRPLPQMVRQVIGLGRGVLLAPRSMLSEVGRCTHGELLLGCWLYARGSAALSAEVLMKAVARLPSDDRALTIMRLEQGRLLGCEMIRAFVGDRSVERALQFAAVVVSRYHGTVYSGIAQRLFQELPFRLDDFRSYRLPTAAEWDVICKRINRKQQIVFLLGRLRLINAFKGGQPVGGLDVESVQYRESVGITADASWPLNRGVTSVINPFVELKRMLRKEDLVTLVNELDGRDFSFLAVSFNRNFKEHRQLQSTLCLVLRLIDHIAGTELRAKFSRLRDLRPHIRRAAVGRLRRELGLPPR